MEVAGNQEGRAGAAAGHDQLGRRAQGRQGPGIGLLHAQRLPFGDAALLALARQTHIEPGRQCHLDRRRQPALPARLGQIIRRRSQRVAGIVRPDVAPAIAGEIDRIGQIGRGNELGMAHGAGPAAGHMRRVDVARLQDLQRRDQLAAEEIAAIALIGQGRQRLDQRQVAAPLAIGRFHAPDGSDHFLIDAVSGLDAAQHAAVLRQRRAAIVLALFRNGVFQIFPQGFLELGLILAALDHLGVLDHVAEGKIQRRIADALGAGIALKSLDPGVQPGDLGRRGVLVAAPFDLLAGRRHAAGPGRVIAGPAGRQHQRHRRKTDRMPE